MPGAERRDKRSRLKPSLNLSLSLSLNLAAAAEGAVGREAGVRGEEKTNETRVYK